MVEQLCNAMNISLVDFFSDTKAGRTDIDEYSLQILSQISECTEEEKKILLRLIKDVLKLKNMK